MNNQNNGLEKRFDMLFFSWVHHLQIHFGNPHHFPFPSEFRENPPIVGPVFLFGTSFNTEKNNKKNMNDVLFFAGGLQKKNI